MKFILIKEQIAGSHEDVSNLRSAYDRNYFLEDFASSYSFSKVVNRNQDLVREVPFPLVDLKQTFEKYGLEDYDYRNFNLLSESDVEIEIVEKDTGMVSKIPASFVRYKPDMRKMLASQVSGRYPGEFEKNFEDAWIDFCVKYRVKGNGTQFLQCFIANDEAMDDFKKMIPNTVEFGFLKVNRNQFFNLIVEKSV